MLLHRYTSIGHFLALRNRIITRKLHGREAETDRVDDAFTIHCERTTFVVIYCVDRHSAPRYVGSRRPSQTNKLHLFVFICTARPHLSVRP